MIFNIIKKQSRIFLRNRHQLFLLILLPIVLITILGVSLGSFFSSKLVPIDVKIGIVEHEPEQNQIEQFLKENDLLLVENKELVEQIKQFQPVKILKDEVFGSLNHFIEYKSVSPEAKDELLNDKTYTAVIEIPKDFTYSILNQMFFNKLGTKAITLHENDEKGQGVMIVNSILTEYKEELAFMSVAGKYHLNSDEVQEISTHKAGTVTAIDDVNPINSKQYYTVGMAVMNVLFVASAIGTFAFQEKKLNVFNRILMSNISRWTYFGGILVSGTLFAFIQLIILFIFSRIVFGVSMGNLIDFLLVTFALSLTVGGISVLLTVLSYRLDSEVLTNTFQIVIISICAFLGGSFFPVGDLSPFIQVIGNFTPNGAGLTAYLNVLRGNDLSMIMNDITYLFLLAFTLVIIAMISYPKRSGLQ